MTRHSSNPIDREAIFSKARQFLEQQGHQPETIDFGSMLIANPTPEAAAFMDSLPKAEREVIEAAAAAEGLA